MHQDPIKFMLQIKEMKKVPENLLKLKSFREHLAFEQKVSQNTFIFRN